MTSRWFAVIIAILFISGIAVSFIDTALAAPASPAGPSAGKPGGGATKPGGGTEKPSDYLFALYTWLLGSVGISALFAFVWGGVLYMFSGANLSKVEDARKWIKNGVIGLVLAAVSFLLLNTINPDLVGGFNLTGFTSW